MNINKQQALEEIKQIENRLIELKDIINNNKKTLDDLQSYNDAEKILSEFVNYSGQSDYDRLLLIIKATNFIDNDYKLWKPDFNNNNEAKYIPYLEKNNGAWLLDGVTHRCQCSDCPVGLYYKKESSAKLMTNRFIFLYNKVWG